MNLLSRRGMSLLETLIVTIPFLLGGIGLLTGVIYVVYHFIMKFW